MSVDLDPRHVDQWDSRLGSTINPRNSSWDRQLEKGLPDCRVAFQDRERNRVVRGRMLLDKVFCAQCGGLYGAVTPNVAFVFFLCDPCFYKGGTPPGCVKVPDAAVRETKLAV